jgi:hypothetical protein
MITPVGFMAAMAAALTCGQQKEQMKHEVRVWCMLTWQVITPRLLRQQCSTRREIYTNPARGLHC